jgi:hypothetical protein
VFVYPEPAGPVNRTAEGSGKPPSSEEHGEDRRVAIRGLREEHVVGRDVEPERPGPDPGGELQRARGRGLSRETPGEHADATGGGADRPAHRAAERLTVERSVDVPAPLPMKAPVAEMEVRVATRWPAAAAHVIQRAGQIGDAGGVLRQLARDGEAPREVDRASRCVRSDPAPASGSAAAMKTPTRNVGEGTRPRLRIEVGAETSFPARAPAGVLTVVTTDLGGSRGS